MKGEQKWLKIDDGDWVIVLPDRDTKPHGIPLDNKNKVELAGSECPCKPKFSILEDGKILITHNSFYEMDLIEKSMKLLTGE